VGLQEEVGVTAAVEELLRYKQRDLDGDPGQWIVEDLDAVLLGLFPAKVVVKSEDEIDSILEEVKTFLRSMAATGRLHPDSDDADTLCLHVDGLAPVFQVRMGDPSRYAWGKRMTLAMERDGVAPDDEEAAREWMDRFNALPLAERAVRLSCSERPDSVLALGHAPSDLGARPDGPRSRQSAA
jgi:hypothetical protein